jgi:hypothetical protein
MITSYRDLSSPNMKCMLPRMGKLFLPLRAHIPMYIQWCCLGMCPMCTLWNSAGSSHHVEYRGLLIAHPQCYNLCTFNSRFWSWWSLQHFGLKEFWRKKWGIPKPIVMRDLCIWKMEECFAQLQRSRGTITLVKRHVITKYEINASL